MKEGYFCRKLALLLNDKEPIVKSVMVRRDFKAMKVVLIDDAEYEIQVKQIQKGILDCET